MPVGYICSNVSMIRRHFQLFEDGGIQGVSLGTFKITKSCIFHYRVRDAVVKVKKIKVLQRVAS